MVGTDHLLRGEWSDSLAVDIATGALASVAFLTLLVMVALVMRKRALRRSGGTVDCSLQLPDSSGWTLGVGRYDGDSLEWYRLFSLTTRPQRVLSRRRLSVVDRRRPGGSEADVLADGAVVAVCVQDGTVVELALSEPALTGFLAWLEASPPGAHAPWF